jgi:hypothetical protein
METDNRSISIEPAPTETLNINPHQPDTQVLTLGRGQPSELIELNGWVTAREQVTLADRAQGAGRFRRYARGVTVTLARFHPTSRSSTSL